ncbi:hypothetical protein EDM56_03855 [Brevibacillus fluminis]|uniref:Uncharacterized protein n=1 Tax=Brevibacillus fluminis TaxID=511487 RepID=A0A3M8DUX8_9BACL|nr:hypothetical protein EDM56_03855 [Brevibacillus fluminis]
MIGKLIRFSWYFQRKQLNRLEYFTKMSAISFAPDAQFLCMICVDRQSVCDAAAILEQKKLIFFSFLVGRRADSCKWEHKGYG